MEMRLYRLVIVSLVGAWTVLASSLVAQGQSRRTSADRAPSRASTAARGRAAEPPAPPSPARARRPSATAARAAAGGPEWSPSRSSTRRTSHETPVADSYAPEVEPWQDPRTRPVSGGRYGVRGGTRPGGFAGAGNFFGGYPGSRTAYQSFGPGPGMDEGEQFFGPEFGGGPSGPRGPAYGSGMDEGYSASPQRRFYPGYDGVPTLARRQPTYSEDMPTPAPGAAMPESMSAEEVPPGPQFENPDAAMSGGPYEGEMIYEGGEGEIMPDWPAEPSMHGGYDHPIERPYYGWEPWPTGDGCGGGADACGSCPQCWGPYRGCGWWWPWCNWCWYKDATIFAGTHAFKGPVDQGSNGNFGFNEGFNLGGPLWYACGLGFQVGGRAAQSNLSGYNVVGPTDEIRNQYFLTAGVFRRVRGLGPRGGGFQWGVVGDYMADNYYVDQEFGQVRAEFSMISPYNHELGFWGAFGSAEAEAFYNPSQTVRRIERWQAQSLYAFFYRRTFLNCGQGRLWGGFTGDGDGLVGGELRMPLSSALAFETNFNYLIPAEAALDGGRQQETWSMMGNLVWYPGCTAKQSFRSRWRPLFQVADNSVFMLERLAGSGAVVAP